MTTKTRQTQHRPPRDERKNKELQSLKKENHKLARKNAQLQKELTRAIQVRDNFESEPEETQYGCVRCGGSGCLPAKKGPLPKCPDCDGSGEERPATSEGMKCPDCGATTVRSLLLAGKTYYVCAECKWRRPAYKSL